MKYTREMDDINDQRHKCGAIASICLLIVVMVQWKEIHELRDEVYRRATWERVNDLHEIVWHPAVRELLESHMSDWHEKNKEKYDIQPKVEGSAYNGHIF